MNRQPIATFLILFLVYMLQSCASIPEKAEPVSDFELDRYLGTWYEIARFDFRFEKDLNNVTATYSLNEDGNVRVLNKGFNPLKKEWKSAEGVARFRNGKQTAALEVSFFGPFYSGYNVIALDEGYRYALVAGKNLDYLWILSREPRIPDTVKQQYLKIAEEVGYNTSGLIWVKHDKSGHEN